MSLEKKKSITSDPRNVFAGPILPEDTQDYENGDLFLCTTNRIIYEFHVTKKKIYKKKDIYEIEERKFIEGNF